MPPSVNPLLYQINTRVWLSELSQKLGWPADLDDISDGELDHLAGHGFHWIWMLSLWQTGQASRTVSQTNSEWLAEYQQTLTDLCESDIGGSGFAITGYTVHRNLGGDAAITRFRERLNARGLKLMLDFVPNHVGLDHPWLDEHPDYFINGTEADLQAYPQNYIRILCGGREQVLAYGRDPYFDGWCDTLQLNYANPQLQKAMTSEVLHIAGLCDGLRCDMAMLILPDIFERTWGLQCNSFWPGAIQEVRASDPGFLFLAEVYWGLEETLLQQGFDYAYDKRLYDRLRDRNAHGVREHLQADLTYQLKLARFLENHDEPRAAAVFPFDVHRAAAVISYLSPGLRFFHQGQLEGRRKRISAHLVRGPIEPVEERVSEFYARLLDVLRLPEIVHGHWRMLMPITAWPGNWTVDCFLSFVWKGREDELLCIAVNYAAHQSQCRVQISGCGLEGRKWRLQDQLSSQHYERHGDELRDSGLFLDLTPWQACVFRFTAVEQF